MTRPTRILLKTVAWLACLWPLGVLLFRAANNTLGPDPTAEIASVTGLSALWILAATLALTPLRRLSKHLNWLATLRRLLGLFVFFYATLHLATYFALYAGFDPATIATDLTKRRFIFIGMATWLLLLPLAATSTQWAIRKLGGKRWNQLHKLVYLAALGGMIHYWWKVKSGVLTPVPFTLVLLALLLARVVYAGLQERKRIAKARAA